LHLFKHTRWKNVFNGCGDKEAKLLPARKGQPNESEKFFTNNLLTELARGRHGALRPTWQHPSNQSADPPPGLTAG
jgi:hypothetical protein